MTTLAEMIARINEAYPLAVDRMTDLDWEGVLEIVGWPEKAQDIAPLPTRNGKELHALYVHANIAMADCAVDPWDSLNAEDRDVWNHMAAALSDK